MGMLSWIAEQDRLSPAALTVQAQTVSPNDDAALIWDTFYNRQPVPSVDLNSLTTLDYRPAADRREWNGQGRRIPIITPDTKKVSMVPIEANFAIDELEMQRLFERAAQNQQIFRDQIMADVPDRTDLVTMACWRRLELDSMSAWANGQIVQRNPENASQTVTLSFGFSSARYTTAPTAWDNGGVNAYDLFIAWVLSAVDLIGGVEGAVMRQATYNAILADAPKLPNDVTMTRSQLVPRMQDDLKQQFEIFVIEKHVDVFDDGGIAYTPTKIWPAHKVAAVPSGGKVGRVAFAPNVRAWEVAANAGPGAGIDVNGVTVYPEVQNSGKRLEVQAQLNALPVPSEQLCCVIDAGV
jgi:hypothetical protein